MEATRLTDPGFWASGEAVTPGASIDPAALAAAPGLLFFQSSGTTGRSRWIGLRREALLLSAAVVNRYLGVGADDAWGLALPLHHVGGFGVVARAYEGGCRMSVFPGRWDAAAFAAWLEGGGVTHTSLVPTQVHDLVAAGLRSPSRLRAVVVGGGVLAPSAGSEARRLGWPVLASYGMTEAGSQVATQGLELLEQPYQTGPLPLLPHWKARVDGDPGRIELQGPSLHDGVLEEAAGGWVFRERGGEWFATSDLGRLEGRELEMLGRADLQVKVLGELVDPESVERELGVDGVVVVALPDPRREHRLVAVVEQGSDARAVGRRLAAYHRRCEGFRRIDEIVRVAAIPRSELGKVRRAELTRLLGGRPN